MTTSVNSMPVSLTFFQWTVLIVLIVAVNGVAVAESQGYVSGLNSGGSFNHKSTLSFIVPPGHSYTVCGDGVINWVELR